MDVIEATKSFAPFYVRVNEGCPFLRNIDIIREIIVTYQMHDLISFSLFFCGAVTKNVIKILNIYTYNDCQTVSNRDVDTFHKYFYK